VPNIFIQRSMIFCKVTAIQVAVKQVAAVPPHDRRRVAEMHKLDSRPGAARL